VEGAFNRGRRGFCPFGTFLNTKVFLVRACNMKMACWMDVRVILCFLSQAVAEKRLFTKYCKKRMLLACLVLLLCVVLHRLSGLEQCCRLRDKQRTIRTSADAAGDSCYEVGGCSLSNTIARLQHRMECCQCRLGCRAQLQRAAVLHDVISI
jgi:hypothetical protein